MIFHLKEHHRSVFDSLPKSASTRPAQLSKSQPTLSEVLSETQPIQPSSAGWYSLRKRSCLLPENINKLFFCRKHYLICDLLFAYEYFM